jgi:hypothetical protein
MDDLALLENLKAQFPELQKLLEEINAGSK